MTKKPEWLVELRESVEAQAGTLDPAQCKFVLSEFRNYEWNALKILEIEEHVEQGEFDPDAEKKALGERHQLVNENASLYTHILQQLKGTTGGKSELEEFI